MVPLLFERGAPVQVGHVDAPAAAARAHAQPRRRAALQGAFLRTAVWKNYESINFKMQFVAMLTGSKLLLKI